MRNLALGLDCVMLGAGEGVMQPMGSPVGKTRQRAAVVSAGRLCTRDKDPELSAGEKGRHAAPHAAQEPSWLRFRGSTLHARFGKGWDYTENGLG